MDGKLLSEVVEGVKTVAGVKTLLVLPVVALHLAVVARCVGTDELVADASWTTVASKRVGRSCLPVKKRLVNSMPLSV